MPINFTLCIQVPSLCQMEARIKKIFHRKRDEPSEFSSGEDNGTQASTSNPALPTSLYDSTIPRDPPQTGTHPIKGNHTIFSPTHGPHASAGRSSLSSLRSPHFETTEVSTTTSSESHGRRIPEGTSESDVAWLAERRLERDRQLPEIPVLPNLSGVKLDTETR